MQPEDDLENIKTLLITQAAMLGLDYDYLRDINPKSIEKEKRIIYEVIRECFEMDINPWLIDIVEYVKIIKSLIDRQLLQLGEAGYLIVRVWVKLFAKTEEILELIKKKDDDEEQFENLISIDMGNKPSMEENLTIMGGEKRKIDLLKIPITHGEKRTVTLAELVDALRDTRKIRGEVKTRDNSDNIQNFDERIFSKLNKGNPAMERENVINAIKMFADKIVDIDDVYYKTGMDFPSFFINCLTLHRNNYIMLEQDVPYGPIRIRKLS
ncbi:hypothetical protein [Caldiplasma sukawensis]